ncbi:MAG: acetate kinase [Bacteroidetes bacterium]|nr:MAG: acetate kinase [Bacteroidota bacterium]RLD93752.1 MAG: acetate kinase [Bacteroidota bacterium]
MIILVLNCGSSSIKYQLFNMDNKEEVIARGMVERIGFTDAVISHKPKGKAKHKQIVPIMDHTTGINLVMTALVDKEHGVLKNVEEIAAVGHRVVQGGEKYQESVLITKEVIQDIEACIDLAPLHNPANLKGIISIDAMLPGIPQIAVFDTSFHQSMPPHAYMYAIPREYYEKYGVRKYGYHGTSHKFVFKKTSKILGKDTRDMKVVSCHLGNGASVTAIEHGRSLDTSMGFTPVDGLIMGTRTGDIDPGVLLFLADKEHLSLKGISNMINQRSGMMGISEISSDMRDLELAYYEGNERANLALTMYAYRVKKFIGAYAAIMNGLDCVIFTGGIGENDFNIRRMILQNMEYLGLDFDETENHGVKGEDKIISKPDSKVTAIVVKTNEEHVIATDTYRILEKCC